MGSSLSSDVVTYGQARRPRAGHFGGLEEDAKAGARPRYRIPLPCESSFPRAYLRLWTQERAVATSLTDTRSEVLLPGWDPDGSSSCSWHCSLPAARRVPTRPP